MKKKPLLLASALAMLLASVGCTRYWCEHHGYYPTAPYQGQPCCVPCCPPCAPAATGYVAPAPAPAAGWNTPYGNTAYNNNCSCPPPH